MQSVFVVQTNEMPLSRNPDWKTQLQFGIFRRREDAEKTMFQVMARQMRNGIDEIREMTSTKRGKGKIAYNEKIVEITEIIPRSIRVCELPLRDNRVRY